MAKEEAVSKVMALEQMGLSALRGATAASLQSCATDRPAPSGTLLLLHAGHIPNSPFTCFPNLLHVPRELATLFFKENTQMFPG